MESSEPDKINYIESSAKFIEDIIRNGYASMSQNLNSGYWWTQSTTNTPVLHLQNIFIRENLNLANINKPDTTIIIVDSILQQIKISNCNFAEFHIFNSKTQTLDISGGSVFSIISLFNGSEITDLNIKNNSSINKVTLSNSKTSCIEIVDTSKVEIFTVSNTIIGPFLLENSNIKDLHIDDSSKADRLIINNKSELNSILINDSKSGNISISNSTIKNLEIRNNANVEDFIVKDNSKLGNILIEKNSQCLDIKILHKSFVENITINDHSKIKDFKIENNSEVKDLRIQYVITIGDIYIFQSNLDYLGTSGGINMGDLLINSSNIKNLFFSSSHIGNLKTVYSTAGNLEIHTCYIGTLDFNNSTIEEISIQSKAKIYELLINCKNCKKVEVIDVFIQNLVWKQETISMINLNNCQFETLLLELTSIPKDSIFQIINCKINKIVFNSFINISTLFFSNQNPLEKYERFVEIDEEVYDQISGKYVKKWKVKKKEGDYLYEESNLISQIQFINSDLGKTSFVSCNLDLYKNFIFYNTKMLDVFVAGSTFPTKISLPQNIDKKEQKEQERLAFGQFKKIYENRGDSVSAGDYQALELEVYRQDLKEKNIKWRERANLYLNKISSNYGNDWLKATGMTFAITAIFYFIYLYLLGFRPGPDKEKAEYLISYFFEFLNPIRKGDFLDLEKYQPKYTDFQWLARILDYVSRIFIAYFVYQTIQAFRRFGKKS